MEREDILRIIDDSPLSFHLSEEDKMEIIERVLSITNKTTDTVPKIKG